MSGKTEHRIKQLRASVRELLAAGMDPVLVMAELAEIANEAAMSDPDTAAANLESLAAIANGAAQAKRGRKVMDALREGIAR